MRAKAVGYRSRAAYKLEELARRYRLIEPGSRVVDLGAWPGGWLQVAAKLAGPRGAVVGVDLRPIEPLGPPVTTIAGDIRDPAVHEEIRARLGGLAGVLLSDLAPQLSGVRDRDVARSIELAEAVLSAAECLLAPGGRLLIKLFEAPESDAFAAAAGRHFAATKRTRPEASRKASAEFYLFCSGFRRAG